jgi:hypothetical protein
VPRTHLLHEPPLLHLVCHSLLPGSHRGAKKPQAVLLVELLLPLPQQLLPLHHGPPLLQAASRGGSVGSIMAFCCFFLPATPLSLSHSHSFTLTLSLSLPLSHSQQAEEQAMGLHHGLFCCSLLSTTPLSLSHTHTHSHSPSHSLFHTYLCVNLMKLHDEHVGQATPQYSVTLNLSKSITLDLPEIINSSLRQARPPYTHTHTHCAHTQAGSIVSHYRLLCPHGARTPAVAL